MPAKAKTRHLRFTERDLRILLALWDAPRPIEHLVATALCPSYRVAARRVILLETAGFVRRSRKLKTGKKGRPIETFEADRSILGSFLERQKLAREWMANMASSMELPTNWPHVIRTQSRICYGSWRFSNQATTAPKTAKWDHG